MWKWTGVSVLSSEILKERTAGNFVAAGLTLARKLRANAMFLEF